RGVARVKGPLERVVGAALRADARRLVAREDARDETPDLADLAAMAGRFGTPFYLYDLDLVERRARRLRDALPTRFEICYAVKATPALAVAATLGACGFGADVASRGELLLARDAGVPAERIVCSGPAKSEADLRSAIEQGVLGVNVEGPHELDRLE